MDQHCHVLSWAIRCWSLKEELNPASDVASDCRSWLGAVPPRAC